MEPVNSHEAIGPYRIYLRPAQLYIGRELVRVTTILGSCVAVTLFHRPSGMAAICHAVQPICPQGPNCPTGCREVKKYADCVVNKMALKFAKAGIRPTEIEVKLFGGSVILGTVSTSVTRLLPVGKQNVEAAMQAIVANRLALKVADVGSERGRKIIFDTSTGEVFLKRLARFQKSDVASGRLRKEGNSNA